MIHELKTWVASYRGIEEGVKTHEWRRDDRDYKVGDILVLQEWDNIREAFTGRSCRVEVTWKTEGGTFGVPHGWCVLSVKLVPADRTCRTCARYPKAGWLPAERADGWVRCPGCSP